MKRRTLVVATLVAVAVTAAVLALLLRSAKKQPVVAPVTAPLTATTTAATGGAMPSEIAEEAHVPMPSPAESTPAPTSAPASAEDSTTSSHLRVTNAKPTTHAPSSPLATATRPAPATAVPTPLAAPPAPETVSPPLTRTDPETPFAADELLRSFGSIAFNTPEEMTVNEVTPIQLLLDPSDIDPDDLVSRLTETGASGSARIRISETVEAVLSGSAFRIRAITPEVQAISREDVTEWRWEVSPTQKGTQRLYLTINALLPSDGAERRRAVKTFDRTIVVRVRPTTTPMVLALIGALILLAIAIAVLDFRRRRRLAIGASGASVASADAITRRSDALTVANDDTPRMALALRPGDVVAGRYDIVRLLGRGGMGAVYAATDRELSHEPVALKTLLPSAPVSDAALQRFRREIQYARRVAHLNVCRIFDLGLHQTGEAAEPLLFVTMELVEGVTLSEVLRREGRLSTAEALRIVTQIAAGLDATHDAGVIHRDLKPGNVMLVPGAGRVVIMDFGLARLAGGAGDVSITDTGAIIGSPLYMAPEQLEGGDVTPATDIYALGLILYELITATPPFEGDSAVSLIAKRLHATPPPPSTRCADVDPRWDGPIMRCLARNPAERFQRAGNVVAALTGAERVRIPPSS